MFLPVHPVSTTARQDWSLSAVTSVKVVEIAVSYEVATGHAATVEICVGTASIIGGVNSVMGSVWM